MYQLLTDRTGVSLSLFISLVNFRVSFTHIISIALFPEYINLNGQRRQEMPE
jgi:hypothetical protein